MTQKETITVASPGEGETQSTALVLLDQPLVPTVVFSPGGVDDLLEKIRREVRAVEVDISTPAGREGCASLAYRVARTKVALDTMGKKLGAEHYERWRAINLERQKVERELDMLRDEVREPLTAWENAEKARVKAHEEALADIEAMFTGVPEHSVLIKRKIDTLQEPDQRDWQEFARRASDVRAAVLWRLNSAYCSAVAAEAAAEEAERLRREKLEQERRERDALIAAQATREAEERAAAKAEAHARLVEAERIAAAEEAERRERAIEAKAKAEAEEAERKAVAERQRLEGEKAAAEARAKKAEADRIAAEEARVAAVEKALADAADAAKKAEREKQKAVEAAAAAAIVREADRQKRAETAETAAAQANARAASKRHQIMIETEIVEALVKAGLSKHAATTAVAAMVSGTVPHVKLLY